MTIEKGDNVVMHTCFEAEQWEGQVWVVESDPFKIGDSMMVTMSCHRKRYRAFAVEFLAKVNLPKIYSVKLKSRKEMEKTIPRDDWGWWIDVCPGKTLRLRDANYSDLERCGTKGDPLNYFCESSPNGSLVSKKAVEIFREIT